MTEAGAVRTKVVVKRMRRKGAPAHLVSFGDMMTLILCLFILLVAMSKDRNFGLMARGIGSFVIQIRSMGLTGILSAHEKQEIFDEMRRRFNLPPEDDPERRATHETAALTELVRAEEIARLSPHDEIRQPRIATFESDSDLIDEASREYIDALADSLRPRSGQVLSLEGHATDAGPRFGFDDARLAFARARAVSDYLVREHGFDEGRIRPKAWLSEVATDRTTRGVDARLIVPAAGGR